MYVDNIVTCKQALCNSQYLYHRRFLIVLQGFFSPTIVGQLISIFVYFSGLPGMPPMSRMMHPRAMAPGSIGPYGSGPDQYQQVRCAIF